MRSQKKLEVYFRDQKVGTLALYEGRLGAFQYTDSWLQNGFPISPFSLPLEKKVFIPEYDPFEGLYGAFADSLPDGWGRLLVDRMLRRKQMHPESLSSLDRLAIVGESGMGALTYRPSLETKTEAAAFSGYDRLAEECRHILEDLPSEDLDTLFIMGGSSGGARPKILTQIEGEDWIIKFPSSEDSSRIGETEFRYAECAGACGIEMPETRLFPSSLCQGYFGVKRFDRVKRPDGRMERIHMLSVSALLETSHRVPNLDYNQLLKLTLLLTGSFAEVEKMYRLMCFNVFAHNRDDHSRNFSFLYDDAAAAWRLSPAYDLTYSNSIGGEHATTVNGNGNPGMEDILETAEKIGISKEKGRRIAEEIRNTVGEMLGTYIARRGK